MNTSKEELKQAIENFKNKTRNLFAEGSEMPVTEHDMNELARQTYYALSKIEEILLDLL